MITGLKWHTMNINRLNTLALTSQCTTACFVQCLVVNKCLSPTQLVFLQTFYRYIYYQKPTFYFWPRLWVKRIIHIIISCKVDHKICSHHIAIFENILMNYYYFTDTNYRTFNFTAMNKPNAAQLNRKHSSITQ